MVCAVAVTLGGLLLVMSERFPDLLSDAEHASIPAVTRQRVVIFLIDTQTGPCGPMSRRDMAAVCSGDVRLVDLHGNLSIRPLSTP
jgi:hypothetical protein